LSIGAGVDAGTAAAAAPTTGVVPAAAAHLTSAGAALQNGGMGPLSQMPPMLGGVPRAANGAGNAPGPRYGLVPTVMAQPPSAGHGSAAI
jgi:hypothetical protein